MCVIIIKKIILLSELAIRSLHAKVQMFFGLRCSYIVLLFLKPKFYFFVSFLKELDRLFLFQLYFIGSDSDILAWLFADTPKGAFANGVLYTLVESARANELDVYEYLKYLLTETPNNHHLEDPSVIDSLLPWSKELPEQCLLKRNRKKCLKH